MRFTLAACMLVAAVVLVAAIPLGDDTGAPTTTTPRPDGGAGTPDSVWELPSHSWSGLPAPDPDSELFAMQDSPLNRLAPVTLAGCPAPRRVTDEEQWKSDVRRQVSCLNGAWRPVLASNGWATAEPALYFYQGEGSDSECGYLTAPAFYCAKGGGSLHFGGEHYEMASRWHLAVNEMVNHEYAHHLQNVSQITSARLGLPASSELERRSELQATCLSAMQTRGNRSVAFDAADYQSWQERLDSMLVDSVHGSRESLRYWGTRGLYAAGTGDCNTWVAASRDVT